jgi:hypothetical protein
VLTIILLPMDRHKCSNELYTTFLRITSERYSSLSLSEVSPKQLSHDSVSRWLEESSCQPKNIWEKAKSKVLSTTGIIIADDTVLSKQRSQKIELVHWQYSGNVHDVIKGIGMLNFFWLDKDNNPCPMDFRIYDPPEDGKTKNDHFQEMLVLAKKRGVNPEMVVFDAWYSSLDNLKTIKNLNWLWIGGLRKNRIVNKKQHIEDLQIPDEGLRVWLRGYGFITVYRLVTKDGRTEYQGTNMDKPTRELILTYVGRRWSIEVFHREMKQTCGLECCQSRAKRAQRNHICLSVLAWIQRAKQRSELDISMYQQKWNVVKPAINYQLKMELGFG